MATTSAAVLAYRPCFVSESATGAQVSTQLIVVNPRGLSSTAAGVAVTPKLIEIQPTLIKVPHPAPPGMSGQCRAQAARGTCTVTVQVFSMAITPKLIKVSTPPSSGRLFLIQGD